MQCAIIVMTNLIQLDIAIINLIQLDIIIHNEYSTMLSLLNRILKNNNNGASFLTLYVSACVAKNFLAIFLQKNFQRKKSFGYIISGVVTDERLF